MTTYNLALLNNDERRLIELQRQAALLIHQAKIGKITRSQIKHAVSEFVAYEQDKMNEYLNHFRQYKKIRVDTWKKKKRKSKKDGTKKARAMINEYRNLLNDHS